MSHAQHRIRLATLIPTEPTPPSDTTTQVAAPAPRGVVPAWHVHRRMYDWVLSLAHHKHSTLALFLLSFAESSFFPIPPDVLQIVLTLERRSRAFYYAAVSSVASILGGLAGYAIGWGLWSLVQDFFFTYVFKQSQFEMVGGLYDKYNFWCVFIAAFTPIPYKVFTIAGGVFHVSLGMFLVASAIGRSARFFLVAWLLHAFGPPIKGFIDRYFNLLSIVGTLLIIGAVVLIKWLR